MLLKIKQLNRVFPVEGRDSWVIKNLDLEIEEGKFTILFGPSGSGKSTLLNLILGIDYPSSGSLQLMGKEIAGADQDSLAEFRKNNVGIVYQLPNWVKALSVIENVAFPLVLAGSSKSEAEKIAREKLVLVGMQDWASYNPVDLSAGQQQRVSLARALVTDPKLIIADEPTGNLDSQNGEQLLTLLKNLVSEQGKSVIMVTHDREGIKAADEVVQLIDGKIVNHFPVSTLKDALAKIDSAKAPQVDLSNQPKLNEESFYKKKRGLRRRLNLSYIFKFLIFIPLSLAYLSYKSINSIFKSDAISRLYLRFGALFERNRAGEISKNEILELAQKNLFAKRSRVVITVGGVALGIGFIVFLSSIGYGLERLVVDRVAGLNELRQTDAIPSPGSNISIDREILNIFEDIDRVEAVYPVANLAGRATYSGGTVDVVVRGVPREYLDNSDIRLQEGEFFNEEKEESNYTAVVSAEILELLGSDPRAILAEELRLDFVEPTELLGEGKFNYQTTNFEVSGVVDSGDSPVIYVPLGVVEQTGISNYSAARVLVEENDNLSLARLQMEAEGFTTTSVADTVVQIENLFSLVRQGFLVIGAIALIIGALGMFNTLTVSLLERIREVGLLKAIGMKSGQVYDLFMFEAMFMGILGGLVGLVLGFLAGQVVSLVLSLLAVAQGLDPLSVSYIPIWLAVAALVISTAVGALTGLIPANRAINISPIDALRYE